MDMLAQPARVAAPTSRADGDRLPDRRDDPAGLPPQRDCSCQPGGPVHLHGRLRRGGLADRGDRGHPPPQPSAHPLRGSIGTDGVTHGVAPLRTRAVLWRSGLLLGLGRERVEEDGDAVSVAAAPTASPVTAALPRQELPSIAARRTATATARDY